MQGAFGHCPNDFCTPLPALKQALWGTSSPKKCPKPSGQGSRPPQIKQILPKKSCPKPSGQGLRPPPLTGNAQIEVTLNEKVIPSVGHTNVFQIVVRAGVSVYNGLFQLFAINMHINNESVTYQLDHNYALS